MYFLRGSPELLISGIGATRSPSSTTVMPERGQPLAEPGNPERGRPHVDAAAIAAEIERDADDVNGRRHRTLSIAERATSVVPHATRLTTTLKR